MTEVLDMPEDTSWQRNDTPVGLLASPRDIAEGNRQGREIDIDDDEDNGETP